APRKAQGCRRYPRYRHSPCRRPAFLPARTAARPPSDRPEGDRADRPAHLLGLLLVPAPVERHVRVAVVAGEGHEERIGADHEIPPEDAEHDPGDQQDDADEPVPEIGGGGLAGRNALVLTGPEGLGLPRDEADAPGVLELDLPAFVAGQVGAREGAEEE